MTLGSFPIIQIMSWSNLDHPCSELRIYHFVSDNLEFKLAVYTFSFDDFPDPFRVAFVIRMNSDSGISKFGFWTGSGDCKWAVFHIIERRLFLLVVDFYVSESGMVCSAVVY